MSPSAIPPDDIRSLVSDWCAHLANRNRAARTVVSYRQVVTDFVAWLQANGHPTTAGEITRKHVENYIGHLLETRAPATASKHYRSLQQFWKWLVVTEEELERSPMERTSPPAVPEQQVPVFTDDELARLLAACKGNDLEGRRDTALLRMLIDTGVRVGELAGMRVDDLDMESGTAHVVGKGSRGRTVAFGGRTSEAVRRYVRARAKHPKAAELDWLWLGKRGPMTDSGIRQMLERRGEQAGVPDCFPHKFRHTFSHRWLMAGGQETDLMRLTGWKSRQMVGRYAASAGAERARHAHKRLALGDKL